MKKTAFLTLLLILSISLMTACSNNEEQPVNGDQVSTEKTTEVKTDTSVTIETETSTSKSDEVLDNIILNDAMGAADATQCEKITNEAKAKECKDITTSLALTTEAVETLDESKCEKITLERYKDICLSNLVTVIENKEEEEEKVEMKEKSRIISQEAVDNKDLELCDQLENEFLYDCRSNILMNTAIQKNDPTICEQIGDQEFIDGCKMMLEIEG